MFWSNDVFFQDIPNFTPDSDHYVYFDSPWTSLVKTSTMFVGELEFSDIPIDTESKLGENPYLIHNLE